MQDLEHWKWSTVLPSHWPCAGEEGGSAFCARGCVKCLFSSLCQNTWQKKNLLGLTAAEVVLHHGGKGVASWLSGSIQGAWSECFECCEVRKQRSRDRLSLSEMPLLVTLLYELPLPHGMAPQQLGTVSLQWTFHIQRVTRAHSLLGPEQVVQRASGMHIILLTLGDIWGF